MLAQEFESLKNMPTEPELKLALKKIIISQYKPLIYLSLKPQQGGFIDEDSVGISVLTCKSYQSGFLLKCSVFYEEKIGGCNCHDDPHSENGYCEIQTQLKENEFIIL
jgi:hypothetical protein